MQKIHNLIPAVLGIALCSAPPLHAQQFGLNMGESEAQIRARGVILKPVAKYTFSAARLPSGNSQFDDYGLLITPKSGLCKITAWISEIHDSPYGDSTKDKYNSLYGALVEKYGIAESFDYLRSGTIWRDSRDWMMSLYQDERRLAAFWVSSNGIKLPRNLQNISIMATG